MLSNHGHVLVQVHRDVDARIDDIADRVGITPRATQMILADLIDAGYLERVRHGRRNHYRIATRTLRHPQERHVPVAEFLAVFDDHPHREPVDRRLAAGARR
ncbi:MAG: helix-turn-helix transcriptional regulator [Angustibacter sp.]